MAATLKLEIVTPEKTAYSEDVEMVTLPGSEGELGVYSELDLQLESQLSKWRDVLSKDVPALNDAMQKNNVPLIAPSAAKGN